MVSVVAMVQCTLSLMETASPIQLLLVGTDYLTMNIRKDVPIVDAVNEAVVLQEQFSITQRAIVSQKW